MAHGESYMTWSLSADDSAGGLIERPLWGRYGRSDTLLEHVGFGVTFPLVCRPLLAPNVTSRCGPGFFNRHVFNVTVSLAFRQI